MCDRENVGNLMKDMGQRILMRRKQLGYTQEAVAEKADLSHQFFSAVETGKKNIKAESIIKLSRALGVSYDYILMGTSNSVDLAYLSEIIKPLNEKQMKHLEEIIRNFAEACKSSNEIEIS